MRNSGGLHPVVTTDGVEKSGHLTYDRLQDTQRVLPESLDGKTVLDVGTFDGYFAFEAERRGADKVVAIDKMRKTDRFEYTQKLVDSDVEFRNVNFLNEDFSEQFDIIICFGVLYHVKRVHSLLDKLARLADEIVCLESTVIPSPLKNPKLFHTDNPGVSYPKLLQIYRNFDEFFPTAAWIRRELDYRGLTIQDDHSFIGSRMGDRVPILKMIPNPSRFSPVTSRYSIRADVGENRRMVECSACGDLIAFNRETMAGPPEYLQGGECPNCGNAVD